MLGDEFNRRQMAEEVFLVFRQEVFDRTEWEDGCFSIDENMFLRSVCLLHALLYKALDLKPFASWKSRCLAMYHLLDGLKGFDVKFGLGIVLLPNWPDGPPSRKQWEEWNRQWQHWQWGWTHLNRGTQGKIPNDTLWEEIQKPNFDHKITTPQLQTTTVSGSA